MNQETIKAAEEHEKANRFIPCSMIDREIKAFIAGAEYGYHAAEYIAEQEQIEALLKHHETYTSMVEKQQQIGELVEALQDLMDIQNGPPLITLTHQWKEAMDKSEQLIQKHRP